MPMTPRPPSPSWRWLAFLLAVSLLGVTPLGWGQSRSSGSYRVESESISAGVSEGTSPTFESTSGAGLPPPAEQTSPTYEATPDLSGQLSVPLGFALAGPLTVVEGESAQYYPAIALDDGTYQSLGLEGASFTLLTTSAYAQLSTEGALTTSFLPQAETLTLQVNQGPAQATRQITVKDTLKDNFGPYAGDGLDDAWQFLWFGPHDPAGLAQADADGDGFTNAYEHLTGTAPTDRSSAFRLSLQQAPEEGSLSLRLPALLTGRRYRLQTSLTLTPPWHDLEVLEPEADLPSYLWTLPLPPSAENLGRLGFYRVVVERVGP